MIGRIAALTLYALMAYLDIWSMIIPDNHLFITIGLWILFFSDDGWPISYKYNKTVNIQKVATKEDDPQ